MLINLIKFEQPNSEFILVTFLTFQLDISILKLVHLLNIPNIDITF